MKTLILVFSLFCARVLGQGYEDSLTVYNAYKNQIPLLKKYSAALNYTAWFNASDSIPGKISCAMIRLKKKFGNYAPVDSLEIEGFGIAYKYPCPRLPNIADTLGNFSMISPQTHFLVNGSDMTVIPYLEKTIYNRSGVIIDAKMVDPITLIDIRKNNANLCYFDGN